MSNAALARCAMSSACCGSPGLVISAPPLVRAASWPGGNAPVPAVVADARRFLWQVRCHLHLLAGHAQDRMVRELQPLVARRLGLGRGPNTGVAELMDRHHGYTSSVRALLTAA